MSKKAYKIIIFALILFCGIMNYMVLGYASLNDRLQKALGECIGLETTVREIKSEN